MQPYCRPFTIRSERAGIVYTPSRFSRPRLAGLLGDKELVWHSDVIFAPDPYLAIGLYAFDVQAGRSSTRFASAERAQRGKEKEKEVRALADKILSYGHSVHRRYPSGEVVVGEDDLAAQLRKHRDAVGRALNLLLGEQKVQKAPLSGYWKLNA